MAGVGYACAVVLAGVFVLAGVAKLAHPAATATGFAALGVPGPSVTARVVPVVELSLSVALLAAPRYGAVAALVLLAMFSAFLARAVHAGVTAGCNCFGQHRPEPISDLDLVRNAMLAALAVAALATPRPVVPSLPAAIGVAIVTVAGTLAVSRARSDTRG